MGPGLATLSPCPPIGPAISRRGWKSRSPVLTYADLRSLEPFKDRRAPIRKLDIHLSTNMERYM